MATWFALEEGPLAVDARGQWRHAGTRLPDKFARMFARYLVVTAQGRYALRMGPHLQEIEVEDAAYFASAVRLEVEAKRLCAVRFTASDGRAECLDGRTLMQSENNVLYCLLVRDGWYVPCRFRAEDYHNLALWAAPLATPTVRRMPSTAMCLPPTDGFALSLADQSYRIGRYHRAPVHAIAGP